MEKASVFLEEHLREAAAMGDIKAVHEFINLGVDVNARNLMNGWTALHWACKRNFIDIVLLLLQNGADKNILSANGQTASSICTNPRILQILGAPTDTCHMNTAEKESTTFVPNYIKNPPLNLNAENSTYLPTTENPNFAVSSGNYKHGVDLVLKIRIANLLDEDFIEIEMPRCALAYNTLLQKCSEELGIKSEISRLRKLPNTRLRNDRDVQRLTDFQEIEVVLTDASENKLNANGAAVQVTPSNNYQSISNKDQTILY